MSMPQPCDTDASAGGEHYLETREHELHWWQLALLDVYCVLLLAVLLAAGAVVGLALASWRAVQALQGKSSKDKTQ